MPATAGKIFLIFCFKMGNFDPYQTSFARKVQKKEGGHKTRAWGGGVLFAFRGGSIKIFLGGSTPSRPPVPIYGGHDTG